MYSRRIKPFGHQTSLRLEPECSALLAEIRRQTGISLRTFIEIIAMTKPPGRSLASAMIAAEYGMTVKKLIEEIISTKGTDPLSSTLRLFVADHFYREYPRIGYVDPHGRLAFVVSKKDIRKRRRARPGVP
jgi:predicted DNA-binding ribbon-helix-helix protein